MKHNMYAIFDQASGLYSQPSYEQSDETAKRSFGNIAQDAEHPIGKHPKDYTLFRVGLFDDRTGRMNDEVNESLCTALESLAGSKNPLPKSQALGLPTQRTVDGKEYVEIPENLQ